MADIPNLSDLAQNLVPNEPELKDLLALHKKDILLSMNCHAVATVESFDPIKQVASVTINYKKTFFTQDELTGLYNPVLVDYPLLLDCPVMVLGGGDGVLTFPIDEGDECLVFFNDRDIDKWFSGNSNSGVSTARLHAFTDGIILVGLRSLANVILDYDDSATELRSQDGLRKFRIEDDAISFSLGDNAVTVTEDKATILLGDSGVSFELNIEGKLKITNETGEFVSALITVLQTAEAGGYPLIADLSTLLSFKAP